jgi:hypothetical protein
MRTEKKKDFPSGRRGEGTMRGREGIGGQLVCLIAMNITR